MMVMVSAGDLMALYMGLELQSLALYIIAAFKRDSLKSTEAGLKYFVLGASVIRFVTLWFRPYVWLFRNNTFQRYTGERKC